MGKMILRLTSLGLLAIILVSLLIFPSEQTEGGDAEVSRYRNLQNPTLEPNNADVTRKGNLQGPLLEPNNADVTRKGNLQAFELSTDFWFYASPTSATAHLGGSTSITVTMVHSYEFDSSVFLTIVGLPSGVTATFYPQKLDPLEALATSTLTLTSTLSAVPNTYRLEVIGSNGTLVQTCNVSLILTAGQDPLSVAQSKRTNGENAYQWQTLMYEGTRYYVFVYSTESLREFSLEDSYADLFKIGETLKMKATIGEKERWIDVSGVIVVQENGKVVKNDELSETILALAEAKAYFSFVQREGVKLEDFAGFYEAQESAIREIYSNPLVLPLLVAFHAPPPTSVKLYKELIVSAFERSSIENSVGKSTIGLNDARRYISVAKKVFTKVWGYYGDSAEIEKYEQAILQSDELQQLVTSGTIVGKLDQNLKEILTALNRYKPAVKPGFYFMDLMLGLACQKTVAEEYLPYLEALRDYLLSNPKSTNDDEWKSLAEALGQVIQEAQGPNSIWYKILYQVYDLAGKLLWNEILKPVITNGLKSIVGDIATYYGLSISQVGSLVNGATLGVGLGLIISDILFGMSSMFDNFDLILKAKQLNSILWETFDKVSSPIVTSLEANIITRRFQFLCRILTYEKMVENADGSGLTGAARWVMNKLRELAGRLLGQEIQTTKEYIDVIQKTWISYYDLLASESVPPLHYADVFEPKWSSLQRSSTLVVDNLMFRRRGLEDPGLLTSIDVDHHQFLVTDTAKVNVTVTNPSETPISNVWINATTNPRISTAPTYAYADSLLPGQNWTATFQSSFNEPSMQALSFQIFAENETITDFVSVSVAAYLPGINVTMNPAFPMLDETVEVEVSNSTGAMLQNATVSIGNPAGKTLTNLTDASGKVYFGANMTGLWSIIATYPNQPAFGPESFIVSSGNPSDFQLTLSDVNSSKVAANATYCKGFEVVNCGQNNLTLSISLLGEADWLEAWFEPVNLSEPLYANSTFVNSTLVDVSLPSGCWTLGYVFFSTDANTTLGSEVTLTVNASVLDSPIFRQQTLSITVDNQELGVSISPLVVPPIYHKQSFSAQVEVKDNYGNYTVPDTITARLDSMNVTANLNNIGTGLYNITINEIEAGSHLFEISVWKGDYENASSSVPVSVVERNMTIQVTKTQAGFSANLTVNLIDTISPQNMTGASVFAVLVDSLGNKTTVLFTETQPEIYEAHLVFNETTTVAVYNLTISASKTGYRSNTLMTSLAVLKDVYLVVRGMDDSIYYRTWNGTGWEDWNVLPGSTIDSPAAAVLGNELHLVVRGSDEYTLWHGYVNLTDNTFSGWTMLDGYTPSAPTLTSNGTALCLAVRGGDDRIYYRTYSLNPGGWGDWNVVSTGATCDAPAAAMLGDNLHIVVRGMDQSSLWDIIVRCDGAVVRDWSLLPGATPSKPVLACSGSDDLCLVVRGMDNAIYYRSYTGSTDSWAGWNALPTGATNDGPGATVVGSELCTVVRGLDGNTLWCADIDLDTSSFTGWTLLDGATPSPPTLTG